MTGSPMRVLPDVRAIGDGREQGVRVGRVEGGRVDDDGEVDRDLRRRIDPLLADDRTGVGAAVWSTIVTIATASGVRVTRSA